MYSLFAFLRHYLQFFLYFDNMSSKCCRIVPSNDRYSNINAHLFFDLSPTFLSFFQRLGLTKQWSWRAEAIKSSRLPQQKNIQPSWYTWYTCAIERERGVVCAYFLTTANCVLHTRCSAQQKTNPLCWVAGRSVPLLRWTSAIWYFAQPYAMLHVILSENTYNIMQLIHKRHAKRSNCWMLFSYKNSVGVGVFCVASIITWEFSRIVDDILLSVSKIPNALVVDLGTRAAHIDNDSPHAM